MILLKQRKHKRHNVPDGTLARAYGSMGEVIDISKAGLSLMVLDDVTTDIPKNLTLDLFSADNIIKARKIPGKLAWEQEVSFSTMSRIVYKKIGVQFDKLTTKQKDQLDRLIMNCTAGSA